MPGNCFYKGIVMVYYCKKCADDRPHEYTGDLRLRCRECGHVHLKTRDECEESLQKKEKHDDKTNLQNRTSQKCKESRAQKARCDD